MSGGEGWQSNFAKITNLGTCKISQFEIDFCRAYHLPQGIDPKYPDSKTALARWFKVVKTTELQSFAELREVFPSADKVQDWIVFNIGGNKYRLIASIHFNRGKVYIRHVLTHTEYGRGDWKK